MTKPANSTDKPSPSDNSTHPSHDNGHKSVVKKTDKEYTADQPHGGNIAKQREKEEQPVGPNTQPPAEKGMDKGQVQPV